MGVVVFIRKT